MDNINSIIEGLEKIRDSSLRLSYEKEYYNTLMGAILDELSWEINKKVRYLKNFEEEYKERVING